MIGRSRRILARQKFAAGGSLKPTSVNGQGGAQPAATDAKSDPPPGRKNLLDGIVTWPVRDQAGSMMCVAYAAVACIELAIAISDGSRTPSQLSAGFLYWAMRFHPRPKKDLPEHWEDGGATFEDAVQALAEYGYCGIDECPDTWAPWSEPNPEVIANAKKTASLVDSCAAGFQPKIAFKAPPGLEIGKDLNSLILGDLQNNRPVGVAFPVYVDPYGTPYWDLAGESDGTLQFPGETGERDSIGGHAVCIIGFEPDTSPSSQSGGGYFIFRNSASRGFAPEPEINACGKSATGAGDGYGRVSLADTQLHCWDLFRLEMLGAVGRSEPIVGNR